ncbi:MAG: hypothetical protein ACJAU6_001368 [Alphaproteobacteria bacterium]|jgi:hypothetical protein
MSLKEPDEPTAEKEIAAQKKQNHNPQDDYLDQYLDSVWESFFYTKNPSFLANFVRHGGDISDTKTREIVANVLDTAPYKNPGGAKPEENIDTYVSVQQLMTFRHLKITPAIEQVAEIKNIAPQSCWDRYNSGAALLGHKNSTRD